MSEKPAYEELEQRIQALEKVESECAMAKAALERERAFFSAVFDSVEEAIVICDEKGLLIRFNDAARRVHGLSEQSIPPEQWSEHYDLHQMDGLTPLAMEQIPLFRALQGEHVQNAEIVVAPKHSSPRSFVCNGQAMTDETGRIIGAVIAMHDITNRRLAEESLRKSEEKYRLLFENMAEGVGYERSDGALIDANAALLDMFGLTRDQFLSRTGEDSRWKVIQEDGSSLHGENYPSRVALKTGRPVKDVVAGVFNPQKNDYVWVQISAIPQFKPGHKDPYQVFLTLHDISVRKRAEKALRESRNLFKTVMNSVDALIFVADIETHELLFVNEYGLKKWGNDIVGQQCWKALHALDGPCPFCANENLLAADGRPAGAYRWELLNRKNRRWYYISDRAIQWTSGRMVKMEIAIDITERKQAEDALRKSEERYRNLFENVSDCLYFHDLEGNFIETNIAFQRAHGYDRKDFEILNVRNLMPEIERHKFDDYIKKIQQNGKDEGYFRILKKDGRIGIFEYKNLLVRDSGARPIGVRGSARDITEKLNAEKERKQMEEGLRHTQKMEALVTMAGAVAHHYNNLLAVVMGNLELAMEDLHGKSDFAKNLADAMHATRRASNLGAMMLTFLGHTVSRREPIDLSEICRQALPDLQTGMPEHVTLNADLLDPGPAVMANADQIRQTLSSLLINAWEAVDKGSGLVSVRICTVSPQEIPSVQRRPVDFKPVASGYSCLEVADTGCGIAKEAIGKLFDPFFSTKFIGRGLGLSVVLGIVKAHGGCIAVETAPGRGSVFRLFLPLTAEAVGSATEIPGPGKKRHGASD